MMIFKVTSVALLCTLLGLAGCGGGDSDIERPSTRTTEILSDAGFDGDIEQLSSTSYNVTQGMSPGVQSVFVGIDPVTLTEFRAFLDFPLTGSGGVPANARIDSAFLDIYIDSIQPNTNLSSIPIRVELVSFQPPTLLSTDFDRTLQPQLAFKSVAPPFIKADVGTNVSIDVTALMIQAQRSGLADFQVRILEELGPAIPVLLEIDDTTGVNRNFRAPLLTVTYF